VFGDDWEGSFHPWSLRSVLSRVTLQAEFNQFFIYINFIKADAEPSPLPTLAAPAVEVVEHVQKKIRDGRLSAHGVNLGSWLVAEQWMSASSDIWKDVPQGYEGEYQVLVHGNNREQRLANFDKHHATFITETDIAAIAKAGFNMVRVPVGWWLLGGDNDDPGHKSEMEAFPKNTVQWVDKLIREWAVRHNIAVLVDIHAAKGSQNGDQHSAPTVNGQAFWGKYPENVRNTVVLAKFIGERYKNDDAFLGIGLLNEPAADTDEKVLAQYHQDAYRAVRESGNDCVLSCMPYRYRQEPDNLVGFMEAPEYKNVWIEWHPYFIWGNESKSGDELINKTILTEFQEKLTKWTSRAGANRLFISEWSLANTGQFRDPDSPDFAAWARAQVKVMNQAPAGWAYWSWHLDGDDKEGSFEAWSLRSVIRREPLRQILLG
jgi:glucan 1,3-beta-glucosidase